MSAESDPEAIETLVARAKSGDRDALERVIEAVSPDVYGLALRMMWHPADAEDASQEILIKIVTGLSGFRGDSRFSTWVYRVASNHLLTTRKRRAERAEMSFEAFAADLADGRESVPSIPPEGELRVLEEEVKIGCTTAMLLCLDRPHRLAYVLGDVFEVSGEEGAEILEVTPAAFRQRLARARTRVRDFVRSHCGIVDSANACRCAGRIRPAIEKGRIDPRRPLFAGHPERAPEELRLRARVREMEDLHSAAALFRSHPDYAAPQSLIRAIRDTLDSGRYRLLSE